jgi:3-oxoacyl-[acyl-carrier protein] reductase
MTSNSGNGGGAMSLFGLDGKTVLISGAGAGMGRAMALGFAAAGSRVIVLDRDEPRAKTVAGEVADAGGECIAVCADIQDQPQVGQAVSAAVEALGSVDILVNNAAIASTGAIRDVLTLPLEELDRMLSVNIRGTVVMSQAVLPEMVSRKSGAVINMGSSWSSRGSVFNQKGGSTDYVASKGGIHALTRAMAQDLAPYGIRVNAIAPGLVPDTEIYSRQLERGEIPTPEGTPPTPTELLRPFLQYVPLGKFGLPSDVVGTAIYLASDASSYVTGQMIHVNGGLLMVD